MPASRRCSARGVAFQTRPDTYYEQLDERIPGHGEDVARLAQNRILIDGAPAKEGGLLLADLHRRTLIGPIFFEIIQRKGNEGFGEGNFRALFESIEPTRSAAACSRATRPEGPAGLAGTRLCRSHQRQHLVAEPFHVLDRGAGRGTGELEVDGGDAQLA